MDVIEKMIENLERFENDVDEIVINASKEFEHKIKQMVQEQLYSGKDYEGEPIRNKFNGNQVYTASYARLKKKRGQPTNRVTLKLEGDYYDGLIIEFTDEIKIQSSDIKTAWITTRYGDEIIGLNQQNIDRLALMITPILIDTFRKYVLE